MREIEGTGGKGGIYAGPKHVSAKNDATKKQEFYETNLIQATQPRRRINKLQRHSDQIQTTFSKITVRGMDTNLRLARQDQKRHQTDNYMVNLTNEQRTPSQAH